MKKQREKVKKITCAMGLKRGIIKKEIFDRELALCKKLNQKNDGKCGWGECQKCGVVPLLYKLHKGKLLEKPAEITKAKNKIRKLLTQYHI